MTFLALRDQEAWTGETYCPLIGTSECHMIDRLALDRAGRGRPPKGGHKHALAFNQITVEVRGYAPLKQRLTV
jgi:hypothetical protein